MDSDCCCRAIRRAEGKEAVVLAAGLGSRIEKYGLKPLIEVRGASLIRRTLKTLEKAGVRKAVVVVGFEKERVMEAASSFETEMKIDFAYNENYREPNGLSLYCAKEKLGSKPFFLTMSDHIFDFRIARMLLEKGAPAHGVRLAVDKDLDRIFDKDDATKVALDGEKITQIGKDLAAYDAVDAGIFLCSHSIFGALEEAFAQGKKSLSDGMRVLAMRERFFGTPVNGLYWQDVDDEPMLKKVEADIDAGLLEA